MLSTEIYDAIRVVEESINDAESIFSDIHEIGVNYKLVSDLVAIIISGSSSANSESSQLRKKLARDLADTVAKISPREIYKGIDTLKNSLAELMSVLPRDAEVTAFEYEVDKISEFFEQYIRERSVESALQLVAGAVQFTQYLKGYSNGIRVFTGNYIQVVAQSDSEKELSVQLMSEMTVQEFIGKLQALNRLYKELCDLHEVSIADRPLKILKIESGSLWAKVVGDTKIIEFVTELLRSGISAYSGEADHLFWPKVITAQS